MCRRRRDIINWEVDDAARIEFGETGKCSAQELIGSLNVCSLGSESQGATVRYPPSYNKVFPTSHSLSAAHPASALGARALATMSGHLKAL